MKRTDLNYPDDYEFGRRIKRDIGVIGAVCLSVAIIIVIAVVTYFGEKIDNAL